MSGKVIHREEYPFEILAEFGLSEKMICDLPELVHENLENGGMSPLLPLTIQQPFGYTRLYARFRFIDTDDGIDVYFTPKLKEMNLVNFSESESKRLLEGKVIVSDVEENFVTDEGVDDVHKIKAFVQLDKQTNSIVYTPTQVIGRNLKTIVERFELTDENLKELLDGNLVTASIDWSDGTSGVMTFGIDLFSLNGVYLASGRQEDWKRGVRMPLPHYSFGNDGCWVSNLDVFTYVPEEEFTKDILDAMERQAKQAGLVMESRVAHEQYENDKQEIEGEETTSQITR